jgi:hypothetical protein
MNEFGRNEFMKTTKSFSESGQQLFWKITLTLLCVLVGALLTLVAFRIL